MKAEEVIKQCTVRGNVIVLPNIILERDVYQQTAKQLEAIGGKWNRKEKGFLFPYPPDALLSSIQNGETKNIKKEFQFYQTPADLADRIIKAAEINPFQTILEPSAGFGAIIERIQAAAPAAPVEYYEINPLCYSRLSRFENTNFCGNDFLFADERVKYDRIIANPPFNKNQDLRHVQKMYSLLSAGGVLVSLTSAHFVFASEKECVNFRSWLGSVGAEVTELGSGAFKDSGTMIESCIVKIRRSK